jgi:hypothetical protein
MRHPGRRVAALAKATATMAGAITTPVEAGGTAPAHAGEVSSRSAWRLNQHSGSNAAVGDGPCQSESNRVSPWWPAKSRSIRRVAAESAGRQPMEPLVSHVAVSVLKIRRSRRQH